MKIRHSIKTGPSARQLTPKGLTPTAARLVNNLMKTAKTPALNAKNASIPLPALAGCEGVDVWITPAQAGKSLGVGVTAIYRLVDVDRCFLVTKRPLRRKILISLRSVRAFSEATKNPLFWESEELQDEVLRKVREAMEKV
jgi:hypothetical protein